MPRSVCKDGPTRSAIFWAVMVGLFELVFYFVINQAFGSLCEGHKIGYAFVIYSNLGMFVTSGCLYLAYYQYQRYCEGWVLIITGLLSFGVIGLSIYGLHSFQQEMTIDGVVHYIRLKPDVELNAVALIQNEGRCCGFRNYTDYFVDGQEHFYLPSSCCLPETRISNCGKWVSISNHSKPDYEKGCIKNSFEELEDNFPKAYLRLQLMKYSLCATPIAAIFLFLAIVVQIRICHTPRWLPPSMDSSFSSLSSQAGKGTRVCTRPCACRRCRTVGDVSSSTNAVETNGNIQNSNNEFDPSASKPYSTSADEHPSPRARSAYRNNLSETTLLPIEVESDVILSQSTETLYPGSSETSVPEKNECTLDEEDELMPVPIYEDELSDTDIKPRPPSERIVTFSDTLTIYKYDAPDRIAEGETDGDGSSTSVSIPEDASYEKGFDDEEDRTARQAIDRNTGNYQPTLHTTNITNDASEYSNRNEDKINANNQIEGFVFPSSSREDVTHD